MNSDITMKDMAQHFGMSLSTIHKAITGKPGVSEATRKRIVAYANANGYTMNSMASCLKRNNIDIAVCLPELDQNSVYFYNYIWQGYISYMSEWRDLNIKAREYPVKRELLSQTLCRLNAEWDKGSRIAGLLVIPPETEDEVQQVKKLIQKGVSVVFVTGDNTQCQRLGAVVADYYVAGAIMAEQACGILKKGSRILFMAGSRYNDAHYMIAKGFHEYMRNEHADYKVDDVFGSYEDMESRSKLLSVIKDTKPDLICCVFARGSAVLAGILKDSGLSGTVPVIANDLFEESVEALKDRTFTNIVYKDPARQAYLAAKMLCEYLVKGIRPQEAVKKVEIALIFKSNVNYYWKHGER